MKIVRDKKAIAIFLRPAFIVYSIIVMIPILVSIYYSALEWNGIGKKTFVGLSNYIKLLGDGVFRQAFWNNIIYIIIVMVLQLGFGFSCFAYIFKKGKRIYTDSILYPLRYNGYCHITIIYRILFV